MKTTMFLVTTCCYEGASSSFSNSWVCATKAQTLQSVMNEICNWAESDLDHYRRWTSNFQRFETAWKTHNLEELIASWNNMSSLIIIVTEQEVDSEKEAHIPEFPWDKEE